MSSKLIWRPYALVSWWDMKVFPVSRFLVYVRGFQQMVSESFYREDRIFDEESRNKDIAGVVDFIVESEEYSFDFYK